MPPKHEHLLCCVDDSEASRAALAEAVRLRDALGAGALSVLHVRAPGLNLGVYAAPAAGEIDPAEEEWLIRVAASAPGARPVLLDCLMCDPPVEAVCWAKANEVDLIVAASHHGAVARTLLGSFAGYVARHAPCPVLLIPPSALARQAA